MRATVGFLIFEYHYWVDRLNPWVLRFGNGFGIRWYGLAYLAGILLAGWILWRWARQGRLPIQAEDVSVFLLAQWVYARSRRPGLTTATVLVACGAGRFVDEFWRQPDVGQPVYGGWMSKGQLLTIPMILIGILWLLYCRRTAVPSANDGPPMPVRAKANGEANAATKKGVDR